MGLNKKKTFEKHAYIAQHRNEKAHILDTALTTKFGTGMQEWKINLIAKAASLGFKVDKLLFPEIRKMVQSHNNQPKIVKKTVKRTPLAAAHRHTATKKITEVAPQISNNQEYIVSSKMMDAINQLHAIAKEEGFKSFMLVQPEDGRVHVSGTMLQKVNVMVKS